MVNLPEHIKSDHRLSIKYCIDLPQNRYELKD